MKKIIGRKFFERKAPVVARELLGKFLVRKVGGKTIALMITETEAYDGFKDKASHASRGKTGRNTLMFGPASIWYVYFTYGTHWMLNIVCAKKDYPSAVLIRGAIRINSNNNRISNKNSYSNILKNLRINKNEIINGPARLTKFLKVAKKFNGEKASPKTGLWIEDGGVKIKPRQIKRSPRIGVAYAGTYWAKKPLRFSLKNVDKFPQL